MANPKGERGCREHPHRRCGRRPQEAAWRCGAPGTCKQEGGRGGSAAAARVVAPLEAHRHMGWRSRPCSGGRAGLVGTSRPGSKRHVTV